MFYAIDAFDQVVCDDYGYPVIYDNEVIAMIAAGEGGHAEPAEFIEEEF